MHQTVIHKSISAVIGLIIAILTASLINFVFLYFHTFIFKILPYILPGSSDEADNIWWAWTIQALLIGMSIYVTTKAAMNYYSKKVGTLPQQEEFNKGISFTFAGVWVGFMTFQIIYLNVTGSFLI